jgi:hypothetical protein
MPTDQCQKPGWEQAPEWAQWLARDRREGWWWFESRPRVACEGAYWDANWGRIAYAGDIAGECAHWRVSLESRPIAGSRLDCPRGDGTSYRVAIIRTETDGRCEYLTEVVEDRATAAWVESLDRSDAQFVEWATPWEVLSCSRRQQ